MVLALVLTVGTLQASPALAAEAPQAVHGVVDAKDIEVQVLRPTTDDTNGPYEIVTTTATDADGRFELSLTPGPYRVIFNEHETGSVDSRRYAVTTVQYYVYRDYTYFQPDLTFKTDLLTGALTDGCSNATEEGTIQAFAADDSDPAHAATSAVSLADKRYRAHGFGGPTKFKVTVPRHGAQWVGGDSFETATSYTVPSDAPLTGADVALSRSFAADTTRQISGRVFFPGEWEGVGGLTVRFYHSTSDTPAGPWTLVKQTTSRTSDSSDEVGRFSAVLPTGMYRITANDTPEGTRTSRTYRAAIYKSGTYGTYDGSAFEDADTVCLDDQDVTLEQLDVALSGGTITGKVTDARGRALPDVKVSLFTDDTSGHEVETVRSELTDGDGRYSIHSIDGPAKLRFTPPKRYVRDRNVAVYRSEWSGDAADAAHATTITVADDESTTFDVKVADLPITIVKKPKISGSRARVGEVLYSDLGASGLGPTYYGGPVIGKRTVQWLRSSGSRSVPIKGATKSRYKPTIRDAGHTLSLRVTYTPPKSYQGVRPVSVTSKPSKKVLTEAHVHASAKPAGWHRFTVKAKITIKGKKKPSGRAFVQWVELKPKGDYLYPTGKVHTVRVRYSRGRLQYTVKTPRQGYWAYAVVVEKTKSMIGHYDDGYVELR